VTFDASLGALERAKLTAPVSHQKRPSYNATNAIEFKRKGNKINEAIRRSAAHNGLVAGSNPAGPTIPLFFSVFIIHDCFSYLSHCLAARMQAILQL